MRKLKLQVQMSIDGYVAATNGTMEWMTWDWDDKLKNYVIELTKPVDLILLGKNLAEGFIDAWASRIENPGNESTWFASKMVDTQKIIFSSTMKETHPSLSSGKWKNTKVNNANLVEEITRLKEQPGQDIIAYGGGAFVSNLIKYNLIDDYHLFINPVALGDGMTIFKGLEREMKLKLKKATPFECGIVVLNYYQKND